MLDAVRPVRPLSPLVVALSLALGAASIAPPCAAQGDDDTAELVERLAKAECEKLMNAVVPIAEGQLLRTGSFSAYAAALNPEGQVINIGDWTGGGPTSADGLKRLEERVVAAARSGSYLATAMVVGVKITLPESGEESSAMAVSLDHRDGYSRVVLLPYRLENGVLTFGEPIAQKGEGRVFASPDDGG